MFMNKYLLIGVPMVFASVSALADTDVALGKAVIATSGYYNSGSEVFPASNIVNGMTGDSGSPSNWSFWLSPSGQIPAYVTVDLGAEYSIDWFNLQDTHNRGYFDRGTNAYSILASTDNVNYTTVVTDSFTPDAWRNLTWNTDAMASPLVARYITFWGLTSYGGAGSVGLNELEVFGTPAAVPEPATMAALGLGALGLLIRRRRS